MELQIFLVAVLANCAYADGDFGGVDMSELEFIVGEMSTAECLQLATALRADGHEKDVEEGVTCLDDLLRCGDEGLIECFEGLLGFQFAP